MRDIGRSVWATLLVVVIVGLALGAMLFGGGQVSGILSTVGKSVDSGREEQSPGEADGGGQPEGAEGAPPAAVRPIDGPRVVRTGSLELVVASPAAAMESATQLVARHGGYVGESHLSGGDQPTARVSFRIPEARWEDELEALRALGEVAGEATEAVDVTGQLVDLQARIDNLRASEVALQGIAAGATTIDDVLKVQSRLSDVRGEIEQLAGQQAHLDDRATFGTLEVTLATEIVAVVEAAREWDPAIEVDQATATLLDILQNLATAGIWLGIVWLPVLLGLLMVTGVGVFVWRRARSMWAT